MRNFACLTTGDVIAINYNEKVNQFIQIVLIFEYVFVFFSFYGTPLTEFVAVCLFQIYELRVMETKPDKAVSIIECDMNVRPNRCVNTDHNELFCCVLQLNVCFLGGL